MKYVVKKSKLFCRLFRSTKLIVKANYRGKSFIIIFKELLWYTLYLLFTTTTTLKLF